VSTFSSPTTPSRRSSGFSQSSSIGSCAFPKGELLAGAGQQGIRLGCEYVDQCAGHVT